MTHTHLPWAVQTFQDNKPITYLQPFMMQKGKSSQINLDASWYHPPRATNIIHEGTRNLSQNSLQPKLQRLDNEASAILQQFMTEQDIDFQLAPPHLHRRNAAERSIRTFKNHFIAGLCSTNPSFPLHFLWDHLVPQALISLNLMQGPCLNPKLSAQAQIHGAFDFNRTHALGAPRHKGSCPRKAGCTRNVGTPCS
eukprot:scaffold15489_cov53-Attheya_sp.AAC.4